MLGGPQGTRSGGETEGGKKRGGATRETRGEDQGQGREGGLLVATSIGKASMKCWGGGGGEEKARWEKSLVDRESPRRTGVGIRMPLVDSSFHHFYNLCFTILLGQ